MKNRYLHIKYFSKTLDKLKNRNIDLEVQKTTYTRSILTEKERYVFNDEADSDNNVMTLIKAVRDDSLKYMHSSNYLFKTNKREKVNFFGLLNILQNDKLISKVDIKSAYWERAKKKGVITPLTDLKYEKLFEGYESKYAKDARLKALGSMATSKHFQLYGKGEKKSFIIDEYVERQKTREIYIEICRDIDELMREMNNEIGGCLYYYWDCMFVNKEFTENAIKFLKDKGYNSTAQETRIEYVKIDGVGYIVSSSDDKVYMTRKEDGYLLDNEKDSEFENNFMLEDYI